MEFDSYKYLKEKKVDVVPILKDSIVVLLKSIKRRLSSRASVRNPWKVVVKHHIHRSIFIEFYRAIRDFKSEFGRTISKTFDRKKNLKQIVIQFNHIGPLKYHLLQAVDDSIVVTNYIKKSIVGGGSAKIVVSAEKPFTFKYDLNKNSLTVNGVYEVVNRYGNICM